MLKYGPPISLGDAKKVVEAAERYSEAEGLAVIIAVVDSAAQLVALHRLDHAQFGSIEVAISKAETAVKFKRRTRDFESSLAEGGLGLRLLAIQGATPIDGGLPLLREGRIIGAIGVAGMLPRQDAAVAAAGASSFCDV
jgi:uncharacterized protein GlcG (DUF336 family)